MFQTIKVESSPIESKTAYPKRHLRSSIGVDALANRLKILPSSSRV